MNTDALRVMLVEDEQNARMTIRAMLSEIGITQVYEAEDGQTAKHLIDTDDKMIDLVISDWNMPNFTGMDLLKYIRSKAIPLPVLMVTGRNDVDSVMEAKNNNVSGYIRKPFSMEELKVKMENIWDKQIKTNNKGV